MQGSEICSADTLEENIAFTMSSYKLADMLLVALDSMTVLRIICFVYDVAQGLLTMRRCECDTLFALVLALCAL